MYLFVSTFDVPIIINHNMGITQVLVIRSFLLETSKWQPNAWFSTTNNFN